MATKQQIREDITKIIQEGVLEQVLPFTSTDVPPVTLTAENYQAFVSDGVITNSNGNSLPENEQTVIYEQDFQTAKNEFNRFIDEIIECYKITDTNGNISYADAPYASFGKTIGDGFTYSIGNDSSVPLDQAKISQNIGTFDGFTCTATYILLENVLKAMTQFQSLSNTSTQINPTQAQEILDTTIFELITQQTTRQQRINQFFQNYSELKNSTLPDEDADGVVDENYDFNSDITTNPDGFIVRLNENADSVNENQTLEWLRGDLNQYFLSDDDVIEQLPIYEDRSSGYLKFREMNQAIIIRNTENQKVIPDTWATTGFTITMWVKFKDKVSSGTLFNYGNPTSTTQTPFGFKLETLIKNNERYLRLVVRDGNITIDSHVGITGVDKVDGLWNNGQLGGNVNQLVNVPMDFNEWYFIVATFDPLIDDTITADNKNLPLYWTGNLQNNLTTTTHHSGLGNKCKVEIISKTDLLRARGYKTQ